MFPLPAFFQLRRRLRQLLRLRGQTREDADDVIQDAFVRLQVYCRKGHEVREPEAFMVRTALRLSSNARRSERRRSRAQEQVRDFPALDVAPAAEDLVEAEQSAAVMNHRLQRISDSTREVFLLHRVDGLSYAQIASLTGLTHKAVERRIAKAMLAVLRDEAP